MAHLETLMGDRGNIKIYPTWIRVDINRGMKFSSYTWSRGPEIEECPVSPEGQVDLVIDRIEKGFRL